MGNPLRATSLGWSLPRLPTQVSFGPPSEPHEWRRSDARLVRVLGEQFPVPGRVEYRMWVPTDTVKTVLVTLLSTLLRSRNPRELQVFLLLPHRHHSSLETLREDPHLRPYRSPWVVRSPQSTTFLPRGEWQADDVGEVQDEYLLGQWGSSEKGTQLPFDQFLYGVRPRVIEDTGTYRYGWDESLPPSEHGLLDWFVLLE